MMLTESRVELLRLYAKHQITNSADEDCELCHRHLTIAEVLADRCQSCGALPSNSDRDTAF
jgi:hypothetical protein